MFQSAFKIELILSVLVCFRCGKASGKRLVDGIGIGYDAACAKCHSGGCAVLFGNPDGKCVIAYLVRDVVFF